MRVVLVCLLNCLFLLTQAQVPQPVLGFSFDSPDYRQGKPDKHRINPGNNPCSINSVQGVKKEALDLNGKSCLVSTNALQYLGNEEFALSFFFKGGSFEFISYPKQQFSVTFNYPYFSFTTTSLQNGKPVRSFYKTDLTGAERLSYDYYNDANWHHILFNYSKSKGRREIWADGVLINEATASIKSASGVLFESLDGFKGSNTIDELGFYSSYLNATAIAALAGSTAASQRSKTAENPTLNAKEYSPGFPDYTVSLIDQLRSFPAPRYAPGHSLPRNISWMDISYLHRELPGRGGRGFGKTNPAGAVALEMEMYRRWHYMLDLPLLRMEEKAAAKQYTNSSTLAGALVQLARQNRQLEYAVITMQAQQNPSHAGFSLQEPFIRSQQLPAHNYLQTKEGKPVLENGRKRLSPLMDPEYMLKDGQTARFYLSQLIKQTGRAPALISENGEVFGTAYRENLLQKDPAVWKNYRASNLSANSYFARFQTRMEELYRSAVLKNLPKSTRFSIFQVSGVQPEFWADYATRRVVNRCPDGSIRSTPDFYPLTPANWQNATGAYNGYGAIAYGRAIELAKGDADFSPFVSAGWSDETSNIRPAQWLALLKSMVMLGADFFYAGYFNITGPGGKWPNGAGPNDPRGYAYQVAIPAYAQAIRSHATEFFKEGQLLNPAPENDRIHQFRFAATAPNDLVLVRKWKDQYLIYGSIQPNTNLPGNVPDERITTIELENKRISFNIRRQGAVYILKNLQAKQPVFYQLDHWHELFHPAYWSAQPTLEAELISKGTGNFSIETTTGTATDFSRFTSYIKAVEGATLEYAVPEIPDAPYQHILLNLLTGQEQALELEISIGNSRYCWKGDLKKNTRIELKRTALNKALANDDRLLLKVKKGTLFLDQLTLVK